MPLQIKLPAHERIIINGAVIQNGRVPVVLTIHNDADVLRRKEVMGEDEACTPARRVYYTLQCAYLFENERDHFMALFRDMAGTYVAAAPSAGELVERILKMINDGQLYRGLRLCRELLEHERVRFDSVGFTPTVPDASVPVSESREAPSDRPPRRKNLPPGTPRAVGHREPGAQTIAGPRRKRTQNAPPTVEVIKRRKSVPRP